MSIVLSAKVADECVEAGENRVIGSSGHQVIGKAKAKSKLLMLRNGSGDWRKGFEGLVELIKEQDQRQASPLGHSPLQEPFVHRGLSPLSAARTEFEVKQKPRNRKLLLEPFQPGVEFRNQSNTEGGPRLPAGAKHHNEKLLDCFPDYHLVRERLCL